MLDAIDCNLLYEDSRDHRALPVPYKAAALSTRYCTIGTLCDMMACTRTCTSLLDHDISAARERHDRGMGMAVYTGARAKIQALA